MYIIYRGHINIISQDHHRHHLHTLNVLDMFGDSSLLDTRGYEKLGDLFAGNTDVHCSKNNNTNIFKQFAAHRNMIKKPTMISPLHPKKQKQL